MKPPRAPRSWIALGVMVSVCACAASQKAAAPAPASGSPAPADEIAPGSQRRPQPREDEIERPDTAIARAKSDIDMADRELMTSAGDCASACRALASMERATAHLCDLASSNDDRARCQEARTKVLAARDRVRSTCGACP